MIEGGLVDLPTPQLRNELLGRLALLRGCMTPATIEQLEGAVVELMIGYPSLRSLPKMEAQLIARKYARDMVGTPLWAVTAATSDISSASVPGLNVDFPPTAPRLRSLVDGYVSTVHQEAREIKEVLGAQQVPPHDLAVADKIKALAQSLVRPRPQGKGPTPAEIKMHYETYDLEFRPRGDASARPPREGA
jgi:hypothetical protein